MNFMERIGGGGLLEQEQSDEEEEERIGGDEEDEEGREEEEEAVARITRNNIISSTSKHQYISNLPSTSSSSGSPHHFSHKEFLPRLSQEFTHPNPRTPPPPSGSHLTDLFLANNRGVSGSGNASGEGTSGMTMMEEVEKEHMFDKVVTPSDVGKLNRLVIPKQHAEKYFPLDGSSNEKDLLLNFEDRNGKPWRFRYSYWNSSQSYVMTKGWSRFVKDKKLDAGDIVSFERGAGEDSRHRLFIDWKRRPTVGPPMAYHHHHSLDFSNVRWGNRLNYSLPAPPPFLYNLQVQPYPGHYNHLYDRGGPAPYYVRPAGHLNHHHHHQLHLHHQVINAGEGGGNSGGGVDEVSPMVIDSVPVVQGRTVGKRLRLFGVNMDCPIAPPSSGYDHQLHHQHEADWVRYDRPTHELIPPPPRHFGSSSSPSGGNYMMTTHQFPAGAGSSLQLREPSGGGGGSTSSSSTQSHEHSKKGKSTSLSFDLDL